MSFLAGFILAKLLHNCPKGETKIITKNEKGEIINTESVFEKEESINSATVDCTSGTFNL